MDNAGITVLLYHTIRAEQERRNAKLEREQRMHYTQVRRNTLRRLAQTMGMRLRALASVLQNRSHTTSSSTAAR